MLDISSTGGSVISTGSKARSDTGVSVAGLGSALQTGVQGMQTASGQLLDAAHGIATTYSSVGAPALENNQVADLASNLLNQRQAQLLFTASAEVVSVADELAGKMIDEIV